MWCGIYRLVRTSNRRHVRVHEPHPFRAHRFPGTPRFQEIYYTMTGSCVVKMTGRCVVTTRIASLDRQFFEYFSAIDGRIRIRTPLAPMAPLERRVFQEIHDTMTGRCVVKDLASPALYTLNPQLANELERGRDQAMTGCMVQGVGCRV